MLHQRGLYKWVRPCVDLSVRPSRIGFRMLAYERKSLNEQKKIEFPKLLVYG